MNPGPLIPRLVLVGKLCLGWALIFMLRAFFLMLFFFGLPLRPPSRHAGAMVSGVMRMVFLFMLLDSLFMHTWLIFMPTWLFPMRTWLFLMRTPLPLPPPSSPIPPSPPLSPTLLLLSSASNFAFTAVVAGSHECHVMAARSNFYHGFRTFSVCCTTSGSHKCAVQ